MKILQLTAENVKKLKIVEITPTGNVVQVTGKNGSGKTSVLDSIWWALGGKDGIQSVPIHAGQKKARIVLKLGDNHVQLIAERKFTPAGTTITVSNAEGALYPSPQSMLDALLGELSFDPLKFARMEPKAQFNELRRVAKVDIDFDAMDAANRADFTRRTDINRQAKAKRAQAESFLVPAATPAERVDETEILNGIQAAGEHNAAIETRKARRDQAQRDANDKKAEGVRLRDGSATKREQTVQRVADLRRQLEQLEKDGEQSAREMDARASAELAAAAELERKIDQAEPLPAPINVSDLRAQLDAAKATNDNVVRRERRDQAAAEAAMLEAQSKELTEKMVAREDAKLAAVKAATMPVGGLGFGEGAVVYNGLPFDQASDAEQLRVSFSLAMAANPKLRVIRIRDGSLLDEDAKQIVAQMADENDYQVWMECVDPSGKVGIFMEDGEVSADNQEAQS